MTKYTINELANSKGVSQPVREALLQMADYKQLYEQVCEQYDVLAKEFDALKNALAAQPEPNGWAISYDGKTPYAIWPEGDGPLLDLEVKRQGGTCCKLPIYTTPPAQPAPVQEPVAWLKRHELADLQTCNHRRLGADSPRIWAPNAPDAPPPELDLVAVYTTPPAAQRQWVGLTDEDFKYATAGGAADARKWEAKLREKNAAAQPAVPDALFRHAPEHPQYIQGWNDCRAEMLKGMK
jgi:hypothetical protein